MYNIISKNNEETDYFNKHPVSQFFVQSFLVIHTFISATKGIFYVFSFIVFEISSSTFSPSGFPLYSLMNSFIFAIVL